MLLETSQLTPHQARFVNEIGNLYGTHGARRLNGQIIGLLLCSEEPMSLGDIAKAIGRSKGLLSQALRRLHANGYVKHVSGPEKRQDYYVADADTFVNVFNLNLATVRQKRSIAEDFLTLVPESDGDANRRWVENLEVMRSFYAMMERCFDDFVDQWRQARTVAERGQRCDARHRLGVLTDGV